MIRFEETGAMYKVKTDWYFDRTKKDKAEFSLNSEKSERKKKKKNFNYFFQENLATHFRSTRG